MSNLELLCIGHRGAMGHAPENTLQSVAKALALGAPCIEVDVRYVDGQLIVLHDHRLESTTNGSGDVARQSFDYLRSLDAGAGQRIATLEEVCAVIDAKACLNIDIRGEGCALPVAALVAKLVAAGWRREAILVSSFDHRQLLELRTLDAQVQIGALICGLPVDDARFAEDLGAFSVHPALDFVDRRFVDDAHGRGLKVYVYTVNHPEDIDRMHAIGVDGVFTDFPERVLERYAQGDASGRWCGRNEASVIDEQFA